MCYTDLGLPIGTLRAAYDVNNRFMHESDIHPELQHEVREILENHLKREHYEFDDKGQITVAELLSGRTIADVRITMHGNPYINYNSKHFIPDDSVRVGPGEFFHNDHLEVFDGTKCSSSYALHIPNDSISLYRIYVWLAKKSFPADSTLMELAEKVASLNELNLKPKTK